MFKMSSEYIEYMLCSCYYYDNKYSSTPEDIKDYLINKYEDELTDKIDEEELLNFKETDIENLYITDNQKLIQAIKSLEKEKTQLDLLNSFIFIKIKKGFDKYFYFKKDIQGNNDYFNKIVFSDDKYYNDFTDSYGNSTAYECYEFICAYFDINKYYQDLILSGLSPEEMKSKFINNLNDIISYLTKI